MAKIREHSPPIAGWCIHCKRRQVDGLWPSQCVEREDWLSPKPGSEPAERVVACEDAATIAAKMAEIRREEAPRCPRTFATRLYDCLRSPGRCPAECPFVNDWIGPEA